MILAHITKKKKMLIVIAFLATSGFSLSSEIKLKAEELSKINTFSIGMNGFTGSISKGEKLYNEIIENDDSITIFRRIIESNTSTPEAKIYALCGLVNIGANKKNLLLLKNSESKVSVLKGDILRKLPFQEVYENIINNGC